MAVLSIGDQFPAYELTAVLASLLGLAASYIFLLVWTPTTPEEYRSQVAAEDAPDRERVIAESVLGIVRAGADMVLTYWAREIAENSALH